MSMNGQGREGGGTIFQVKLGGPLGSPTPILRDNTDRVVDTILKKEIKRFSCSLLSLQ